MATVADVVTVGTTATLLWRTTSGVSPDPAVAFGSQIFPAGTQNDPRPILIENQGAGAVYLGGSGVTDATGIELASGGSLTYNVIGNDSLYAVAAASESVAVSVGRL